MSDPLSPIHEYTRDAMMAEMLLRCFGKKKTKSPFYLSNKFFESLAQKQNERNSLVISFTEESRPTRMVNYDDLKASLIVLEQELVFRRLAAGSHLYEPHKRTSVEAWRRWIDDDFNARNVEMTRQALIIQEGIQFPPSDVVDSVCENL